MAGHILSIGECMVELMQAGDGLLKKGYAGDTFNTAYYVRLFLPETITVDYFTAVGDETVSEEMLAFMAGTGVSTRHIRRIAGRMPGLYMIHLKNGERSFSYWRSTSAAKCLADDADALRAAIDSADTIVVTGVTLAILSETAVETLLAELRRAKAAGRTVVFDPNIRPRLWSDKTRMLATISDGARAATLVMPSFDDEATHFGDATVADTIARYRSLGVENIVVKDGANGATVAFGAAAPVLVPAAKPTAIVDTTSAGDSFNGAFLAHLTQHGDPQGAAAFAARVASAVIAHHGALIEKALLPA
ncbi:sugar kinase [Rhizobium sp. SG2393]|uniref:sugar kinase n=1 Tax=Rhizobium sp. SG2393 TaxID=3276279 RepID=UPI00366E3A3C